jgi:hypothetical protein
VPPLAAGDKDRHNLPAEQRTETPRLLNKPLNRRWGRRAQEFYLDEGTNRRRNIDVQPRAAAGDAEFGFCEVSEPIELPDELRLEYRLGSG